jgi:hypothetical protein
MQNKHTCNIITEKIDLSLPFTFKYTLLLFLQVGQVTRKQHSHHLL